jgi:hypothetical protein
MYKTIKTMRQALEEARSYRDPIKEDKGFSTQQIKMAYGILNDPRYKQGNYSGAVSAIDKIAKGLSDHPDVANALKRANESLEEAVFDSDAMQTIKLKNGTKVLDKIYTDRTQADNAASSLMKQHKGAKADAYYNLVNKKFYVRIKELPSSFKEETITEFKKMTVTFKDMDSFAKAYVDLAKKGFKLQGQGLEIKVDGNGADLNKYAADMNNFYGATVKAESLEESIFDGPAMQTIKLKNGTKVLDKVYTNRFDADNAASALMKHPKGNNITKADAYYNLVNKKFYVRIKEDLEEVAAGSPSMRISKQDADKFDMAKYKENERDNRHSDNALLLVKKFGSAADYKKIVDIDIRHQKAGSLSMADFKTRNDISRKYIGRLL